MNYLCEYDEHNFPLAGTLQIVTGFLLHGRKYIPTHRGREVLYGESGEGGGEVDLGELQLLERKRTKEERKDSIERKGAVNRERWKKDVEKGRGGKKM